MSDEQKAKDLDTIQSVAATVFGAAADTTSNAILTLIFALATQGDFRKRIQEELDLHLIEKEEQSGTPHVVFWCCGVGEHLLTFYYKGNVH